LQTVSGAVSGAALTAPLSGLDCVWYKLRVESWQANGAPHHRETVYLFHTSEPVLVGQTPVSAGLVTGSDTAIETVTGKRPPTRVQAPFLFQLADIGLFPEQALTRRAHVLDEIVWQTTEVTLRPGTRVTARGRVSRRGLLQPAVFRRSYFANANESLAGF
jgi:hypothetical protein